jgi:radical SAM superfamily enzyme YgiQ (UPF0313 family)
MKVLLISPPIHFEFREPSPSLTLAVLSDCLKRQGIPHVCVDGNFIPGFDYSQLFRGNLLEEKRVLEEQVRLVIAYEPDVVALSSWGVTVPFALMFAETFRKRCSDVPVIVGGLHDSYIATKLLEWGDEIDAATWGDGELVLLEMLDRIRLRRSFTGIPGVVHRDNGRICMEAAPTPLPPNLWGKPDYQAFILPSGLSYSAEGSRGCSYKCIFCSINSQSIRRKEPGILVKELQELLREKDNPMVNLVDNFIPLSGGVWINDFCNYLIAEVPEIRWSCCARADNVDSNTVRLMARAGCAGVFLGVESASLDTLTYINKSPTPHHYRENLLDNIRILRDHGLFVSVSTIIGFPYEGVSDMQYTVDFVLGLQDMGVMAFAGPLVVTPGSRLWNLYLKKEIHLCKIRDSYIRKNYHGLFSSYFEDIPYLVPNNFLIKHKFLPQEYFESILSSNLKLTQLYCQNHHD